MKIPFDPPTFADDSARWQAVLVRDERADGAFVYGVGSTQIYCRASCPSRRPRRENARFFETPENAEQAGFRACKRCRPANFANDQIARARRACRIIEANEGAAISLEELGQRVGASPFHLQRSFKRAIGVSPREYAQSLRLGQLKAALQRGESVLNAALDAGYNSTGVLYENATAQLGMTPATYGRGGKNARIWFGIAPCELDLVLVATTETGVCSVALGDDESALETELRAEFFAAQIERDEVRLRDYLQAIIELCDGEQPHQALPLDVRATAFQSRVWRELRAIPAGQTRTYAQVAQSLEMPTASRAVARACATNPVALVVPCHRVVRSDGNLAGYRWGIERKKCLLEAENSANDERGN